MKKALILASTITYLFASVKIPTFASTKSVDINQANDTTQLNYQKSSQKLLAKNGDSVFNQDELSYRQYKEQAEIAIQEGAKVEYREENFIFEEEVNTYKVKVITTQDGKVLNFLEKTSGKNGPDFAAGYTEKKSNIANNNEQEKVAISFDNPTTAKSSPLSGFELVYIEGQDLKTKGTIFIPLNSSRQDVAKLLQPLVDKQLLSATQVEGWVGTEIFYRLQQAKQEPGSFTQGWNSIGEPIKLPNNLASSSIYYRTGLNTVEHNQRKANLALFALISQDGAAPGTTLSPELGIAKVLEYAKGNALNNINRNKLNSSYSVQIRRASNLTDLTNIFNQAGKGKGLQLNPNNEKDRQWLYGSLEKSSPHYYPLVYGKNLTPEQIRTALYIKEWLRAASIQYAQDKMGLDTEEELALAFEQNLGDIHPDIAKGLANYITHDVANPDCKINGFCYDLDIATQSSIAFKGVEQKVAQTSAANEAISFNQVFFYPGNTTVFSPLVPGLLGAGAAGFAFLGGGGDDSNTNNNNPDNLNNQANPSSPDNFSNNNPPGDENPNNPDNPTTTISDLPPADTPGSKTVFEPSGLFGIALLGLGLMARRKKEQ